MVITGDRGWVYVNGKFQGGMDLSVDTGGDGITIFIDDEHAGETSYKDFAVWKWSPVVAKSFLEVDPDATPTPVPTPNPRVPVFGPQSGRITHNPEDGFQEVYAGPTIEGDVMLEVTFENPFAPNESHWNYGILFDSQEPETYHHVQISSLFGGAFNHWRRAGRDDEVQGRLSEDVQGLNFDKNGENHIRLIILGDEGHLYVNDRRVSILNFKLGNVQNPERISLIVNDSTVHGYKYDRGGATRFEDFTVWKWHPSLFDLPKDD